jgi:hypothetical protein
MGFRHVDWRVNHVGGSTGAGPRTLESGLGTEHCEVAILHSVQARSTSISPKQRREFYSPDN